VVGRREADAAGWRGVIADADAAALGACVTGGGVAVFPADTVYGLACDPANADAVKRLYALKGRAPDKPAAVMWFVADVPLVPARARALLPGGVTLLVPNPDHLFPLAGGGDVLGVRVPFLAPVGRPVLQSSANRAGGADARRLDQVPDTIRAGADLVIDGGELPGTPSTVIDLTQPGRWSIAREGAVSVDRVASVLGQISDRQ
jgi:L-threonylcarbamoyladenylate synthase